MQLRGLSTRWVLAGSWGAERGEGGGKRYARDAYSCAVTIPARLIDRSIARLV